MPTFEELTDRLTELCGDNTVFFTLPEKKDALNEAFCVWQTLVGEWKEMAWEISTVRAGTALSPVPTYFYVLPRQLLTPTRVSYSTNGITYTPLALTSLPEMDYGRPGWEDYTPGSISPIFSPFGTPAYWGPNGIGEIFIWPAPNAGAFLKVEGFSENPRLVGAGDLFPLGEDEVATFLLYAHHYLTFKEAGAELSSSQEELKTFFDAAVERNDVLTTTQFYRRSMGLVREESERPAREGQVAWGIRGKGGTGSV